MLIVAAAWATMAKARLSNSFTQPDNAPENVHTTQLFGRNREHSLAARARDPSKVADDAMWATYVSKGQHLKCIMEAPAKGAEWLEKDTRTRPSAASKWTGDLTGLCTQSVP